MSRDDRDRAESPWYCPECEIWVGWKHDECLEGHRCPRLPLRYDDVEFDDSWRVTRRHRLRGKLRSLRSKIASASQRDRKDWPTPTFDRPGTRYFCGICSDHVVPEDGEPEAGLLIAGGTWKLCADCSRELRDAIQETDQNASIADLLDGDRSEDADGGHDE